MSSEQLAQLGKRLTLNLLIQGSATHSFFTAHHLARDELNTIDTRLVDQYDRVVPSGMLNYWIGDVILIHGPPCLFWKRVRQPNHPFHCCDLLRERGAELAEAMLRRTTERAVAKGVYRRQPFHYLQGLWILLRTPSLETPHRETLEEIAIRVASQIWGIDRSLLSGELRTLGLGFGQLQPPRNFREGVLRLAVAGYGGVVQDGVDDCGRARLKVVAQATMWPLLVHELVKGVAELICLHGLNTLDDETYETVCAEADRLQYEIWCMQAGGELWRRLLEWRSPEQPIAECLMHIARLPPDELQRLMFQIVDGDVGAESAVSSH